MTKPELDSIINYNAGMCLCGHFESCSVCSRPEHTRKFERLAVRAAKQLRDTQDVLDVLGKSFAIRVHTILSDQYNYSWDEADPDYALDDAARLVADVIINWDKI